MNKEVYITSIKYKNKLYDIYIINGQYAIHTDNNTCEEEIKEILKLINNNKLYKTISDFKLKELKRMAIIALSASLSLTSSEASIKSLKNDSKQIEYEISSDNKTFDEIADNFLKNNPNFDNQLYELYVNALNKNDNLTVDEKKIVLKRFWYANSIKDYIDKESLQKNLSNLKINYKTDTDELPTIGAFYADDKRTSIDLYKYHTDSTIIHEIIHLIKNDKAQYDDIYFCNGKFYEESEYRKLSLKDRKGKNKYSNLSGSIFEEGDTEYQTIFDKDTPKSPYSYRNEVLTISLFREIYGSKEADKLINRPNSLANFLNLLLEYGYTEEEAVQFISRTDLLVRFNQNNKIINNEKEYEYELLKYQVVDEMAHLYTKKTGNSVYDSIDVMSYIFTVTNNLNFEELAKYKSTFHDKDLFTNLKDKHVSIKNYIKDNDKEQINQYNLNVIDKIIYNISDKSLRLEINNEYDIILNKDNDAYDAYVLEKKNEERQAKYYAAIVINHNIDTLDENVLFQYYEYIKDMDDNEFDKIINIISTKDLKTIVNCLENIKNAKMISENTLSENGISR